jgi:hypothetical protein
MIKSMINACGELPPHCPRTVREAGVAAPALAHKTSVYEKDINIRTFENYAMRAKDGIKCK